MRLLILFIVWFMPLLSMASAIPTKAYPLLPVVRDEVNMLNPGFTPAFMASHIEQESCLSLTHSKCWSPESRLLTYWDKKRGVRREHGQGLGQITRAWTKDGNLRFDTLDILTRKYQSRLKGLTWDTVANRADLQIRAMALLLMEGYTSTPVDMTVDNKSAMAASAYNAGAGRLSSDRRTCQIKKGCDPREWFGNVELIKSPGFSTRILYGGRTSWDVNRHHVKAIMAERIKKYITWYNTN